jgi:hypothetical protein
MSWEKLWTNCGKTKINLFWSSYTFFWLIAFFLRLNSSLIASNLLNKGKIEKRGLK